MENKKSTHLRGVEGENLAVGFLQKSGYVILGRNYRSFRGEIDIIALDGDVLVFIEVKAWSSYSIENLQYSINKKKCKKIIETAKYFLQNHRKYIESNIRFDVVFVGTPNITHIKAAFTENICQGIRGERRKKASDPARVEELKKKINNEEYLNGAVARIAQVLSNQMLGIPQGGAYDERQWEGK